MLTVSSLAYRYFVFWWCKKSFVCYIFKSVVVHNIATPQEEDRAMAKDNVHKVEALGQCIPPPRHVLPVSWYTSLPKFNHLNVHWPWKLQANPFGSFCAKLLTDNDENIIHLGVGNKNSSGDEIANVNFLRRHRTCTGQRLRPLNRLPNFDYKYLCRAKLCT